MRTPEILTARVVPYREMRVVRGRTIEFDKYAFARQIEKPDDFPPVLVQLGHGKDDPLLGEVVGFTPLHRSQDWLEVHFSLAVDLPDDLSRACEPGASVSASFGYAVGQTSTRDVLGGVTHEKDIYLEHLAVVPSDRRPAIHGAMIVDRRDWHDIPWDTLRGSERTAVIDLLMAGVPEEVVAERLANG